jgi:hypothetical protein
MFYDPVIWNEENQLSADTVVIQLCDDLIDKMYLYKSCFIVMCDDSTEYRFNQVKGAYMTGFFDKHGELYKIHVTGNTETIYFLREDNGRRIGINKAISNKLDVFVSDNEIKTITFLEKPVATLYPENELTQKEMLLKNFRWLEKYRPKNKTDIFYWE